MNSIFQPRVETNIVSIAPALANEWLSKNGINRPLDKRLVSLYANSMTRGAWVFNGEAIIFGEDGRLLDGQHRLAAIIESNTGITAVVVRGVPAVDSAFHTIDSGKSRSNPDRLAVIGEKNANDLSALVRAYYVYHSGVTTAASNLRLQPDLMFRILDRHPDMKIWASHTSRLKKYKFIKSLIGFVLFAGSQGNQEMAIKFLEDCESGANLSQDNPACVLRNRILSQISTERIPRAICFAMYIKSWNAYVAGRSLSRITWQSSREEFPEILHYPMNPEHLRKL